MTTRTQPYRRAMPLHIFPLIKVASRITLYLINQSGPTSFTFKDRLGGKNKATIGNSIHCSCQIRINDHCLHTIYILIRIFKIPIDNPLIWQNSFLDSELNDIVSGKYSAQTITAPILSEILTPDPIFMEPTKILHTIEAIAERKPIKEESQCPICQEELGNDSCITYCKIKCGNNFHLNCLKIWIQHKQSVEEKVSCPMCRCQYNELWIESVRSEQRKYIQQEQRKKIRKMKYSCESCGKKQLVGIFYKCLLCENYCLCFDCFLGKKHIKHPFIKFNGQQWHGAEDRIQQNKKLKQFLEQKRKQAYRAEQIIQKLKKLIFQPVKILDFIAGSFPYVSQYISQHIDPYSKLEFNADDIVCFSCGNDRMIYLRRLNCGHFIDHDCLKGKINSKKFHCDKCGGKFLKGYQNLLKNQDEVNNIIEQTERKEQKLNKPISRRQSFDTYNFRMEQDSQESAPEGETLLSILGGAQQTVYTPSPLQLPITARTNTRLEENIRRNVIRQPPSVPLLDPQIRVRNLSLNGRKPPKPPSSIGNRYGRKKTTGIVGTGLTIEGMNLARNRGTG